MPKARSTRASASAQARRIRRADHAVRACAGSSPACITTSRPGRGLLYRACASADPFPDALLAATAKVFCNEMSIRVTSDALQVFGGYGFTDDYLVSRLYRGARYGSLGGGTSETLRDLIGKRLMDSDMTDGIFGISDF